MTRAHNSQKTLPQRHNNQLAKVGIGEIDLDSFFPSLRDKIRLLGFTTLHDSRRYAMPRCLDPSHPDTKVRLTGDDEYAPTNLGTRPGRRCWTAVRNIYLSIYLSIDKIR